jgi:hypothetical protein
LQSPKKLICFGQCEEVESAKLCDVVVARVI